MLTAENIVFAYIFFGSIVLIIKFSLAYKRAQAERKRNEKTYWEIAHKSTTQK